MQQKIPISSFTFRERHICPYFNDGRISTIEYIYPDKKDKQNFHKFLAKGYRRLGCLFYRNVCDDCKACLPIRLEVRKFKLSRSHKRTLKRNEDVRIEILSHPLITPEKIVLYEKYVVSKHAEEAHNAANILINIHHGYPNVIEMDYYLNNGLISVGIVDEGKDSLSSNYFYYDTDYLDRRLGVFSIINEISLAAALGKKYYYLGFYIEENSKMSYKKYFRPNQIYRNSRWRVFLPE
jgi:arginine-tRNA-protein transferase